MAAGDNWYYFICKKTLRYILDFVNWCENCMYYYMVIVQVLKFELYSIIAKLVIMYKRMLEYFKHQLSAEYKQLYAPNPKNWRTIAKQILVSKVALDILIIQKWLDNNLANIKFSSAWRK